MIYNFPKNSQLFFQDLRNNVQNGCINRVKFLLEHMNECDCGINDLDNEGVTLLHWASINARIEIINLLLSKGANVNAPSTIKTLRVSPLFWAIESKQVEAVVTLLKNGGNPNQKCSNGSTPLHLAASNAMFLPMLVYLVAKGGDPNLLENKGMSPLMWAAGKIGGYLYPLTKNGASAQDTSEGNTALHWAIYSQFWMGVSCLLTLGARIDIRNFQSQTPRELLMAKINSSNFGNFILVRSIRIQLEKSNDQSTTLLAPKSPTCNLFKVNLFIQIMLVSIFCFILDTQLIHWMIRIPLIAIVFLVFCITLPGFMESFERNQMVLLTLFSNIMLTLIWIIKIFPLIHIYYTIAFVISSVGLWYNFLRAWLREPGVIKYKPSIQHQMIIDLVENGVLNATTFCATCIVRRPLRSKHCSVCNHCVAKFDHHCTWIGNCVGLKNHLNFVLYLTFKLITGTIYFITIIVVIGNEETDEPFYIRIPKYHLLFINVSIFIILNCIWISGLLLRQLYQVLYLGMTTNECMNRSRYNYLNSEKNSGFCTNAFNFCLSKY